MINLRVKSTKVLIYSNKCLKSGFMKSNSQVSYNYVGHSISFYKFLIFVLFYSYPFLTLFLYNSNQIHILFA